MKYKVRRFAVLISILLVIAGLAVYFCYDPEDYDGSTVGTITRIEEAIGGGKGGDTFYKVLINYAAGGREYKDVEYSSYTSDMRVGQTVTVRYKTKDPSQIAAPEVDNVPQYGLSIAIIGCIIWYLNSRSIKRAKRKAQLEENARMAENAGEASGIGSEGPIGNTQKVDENSSSSGMRLL
ncbi:MAG: DUF3592 domain-containing protein [Clostridia bacterium]|nr:DUF3592 domain-containing protein [Clostridia bacterium]